jgi:signal transduction histidine kinase/ActR/RegA family two-component response regulator
MQQYSSLPEKNLQVDETPKLLNAVQQLRAELCLERGLNKLQSRFNEFLISACSQNLQFSQVETEAEIFQVVVDELKDALNLSQLETLSQEISHCAIALSQIGESTSKISYISSSSRVNSQKLPVMLKSQKELHFDLEELIDKEDLLFLEAQEPRHAFLIALGSEDIVGWLIVTSDPPNIVDDENYSDTGNDTKNNANNNLRNKLRSQFIEQAIQLCVAALRQIRQIQSLQQVCQHLENFNQELQRTNQVKNQFLANTSHEIRTPLSSILGFTHLLLAQGFDPSRDRHQEYLNIIQSSGKHLLALINDILDLSKIEANQMEVQLETVDLPALCRTVFALVKEKAANKGLQIKLELDTDVTTLTADSLRLKQMLLNLLFNALKFTEKGAVGLHVKQQDDFVYFVVWDTGTGIPKEHQGELFQPYSQIANALVGRDEGTGLGLSVTRKLAELHGGYVEVESEVDKGSQFTIILPLNPCLELLEQGGAKVENIDSINDFNSNNTNNSNIYLSLPPIVSSSHSPKIVLVEDDLTNAQLIQTYLGKLGYQITWVKNAAEMWQLLSEQIPAIILMDIYLPDGNGLNLIKQLRRKKKYKNITVIAQTAMAMKGDHEICLAAGFDEYICKPIELPLLAALVAKSTQTENLG